MNTENFGSSLKSKTAALQQYMRADAPKMASAKILRFIDGNFRAQGWQGKTFKPWRPNKRKGTILIKKGHLRRSFKSTPINEGMVRTWSSSRYAKIHNNGFNGTINIPAHERRKLTVAKIETGKYTKAGKERQKTVHNVTGTTTVRSHTRRVNVARRQMMPTSTTDSPVLMSAIKREIAKTIKHIFSQ